MTDHNEAQNEATKRVVKDDSRYQQGSNILTLFLPGCRNPADRRWLFWEKEQL
jgi:hypothetical protein